MTPLLDENRRREHKLRNDLHSALLVAGLGLVTAFSVWLLWSWIGVLITLDDFGTCFATLNYLRSFPFKKIKIDRSFVRDIPEHHDCVAIVKSVGDLARELVVPLAGGREQPGGAHGQQIRGARSRADELHGTVVVHRREV